MELEIPNRVWEDSSTLLGLALKGDLIPIPIRIYGKQNFVFLDFVRLFNSAPSNLELIELETRLS